MKTPELLEAYDTHVCGEPGRVIVSGMPDIPGESMFEKMKFLEGQFDSVRKLMLREPRGYPAANCNIIFPSTKPGVDAGYVIMEQVEYAPMSGTNTIAVTTVLIESGRVKVEEPITKLTLESPAGLIQIEAEVENGKVTKVTFENVPAFSIHLDQPVEVPELGTVMVDVAWGGMFFVIADAPSLGLKLTPDEAGEIVRVGEMIKAATQEQLDCVHPLNPKFRGVTIAQLSGPPLDENNQRRNSVIVSTGELNWDKPNSWKGALDRSPCGTGTCAKMATLYSKGQLGLNQEFHHEGILSTVFTGKLLRETQIGEYKAVVPTLSGSAWITGHAHYRLDPSDPFPEGFTVGDIWAE